MAFTGAPVILSRFTNLRSAIRSSNNVPNVLSKLTCRLASLRLYSTSDNIMQQEFDQKKMSKAMKMYLQRAKDHHEFMKEAETEFQIGKRHLANIMGEDPETFTQADIDRSIEYLFPSGIYDKKARPHMKPPEEVFPQRKAAEFDESGRPYHTFFYTCKPNFNQLLFDTVTEIRRLNKVEDDMIKKGVTPDSQSAIDLFGSVWLSADEIGKILLEPLIEQEYATLIATLDRLVEHPYSYQAKDYIMKYRKHLQSPVYQTEVIPIEYNEQGRPYVTVKDCMRKSARGVVTIWGNGTGQISINGKDISYFEGAQPREQGTLNAILIVESAMKIYNKEANLVPIIRTFSGMANAFCNKYREYLEAERKDDVLKT